MVLLEPNGTRGGKTGKLVWSDDHVYHPYADGDLDHDYFVGAIEHLITGELPDVSGNLEAYVTGHGDSMTMYRDMKVPGLEGYRADVLVEKRGEAIFVGEAKDCRADLCNREHTNGQISAYISYLYNQRREIGGSGMRYVVVMGVPFCLSSEARRVFRSSVMKLMQTDPGGFGMSDPKTWLELRVATEIDGKDIPDAESGFEDGDPLTENFRSRYTFGNRKYRCFLGYMDINSLTLDPHNVRFKDDMTDPDQEECMRRLLTEGDVTSANLNVALERKRTFIDDGSIHEPLDVFIHDVNGTPQNLVVEGNSRLANCKDIVRRANSAPAYRIVPVRKFFAHDGITEMMMDDIKEHEQHKIVLPHENARIAIDIASMLDAGMSCDDVRRRYGHLAKNSDQEIREYADAIHRIRAAGCDAEYMTRAYGPVWSVITAKRDSRNSCNFKGFDMDLIVERLVREVQNGGKFGMRYSHLCSAIGSKRKNEKQIAQLRRWIQGEYDDDDRFGEDWKRNGKYEKERMNPQSVKGSLESMQDTVRRLVDCVKELDNRPVTGMHGKGGFSVNAMRDISVMSGDMAEQLTRVHSMTDRALRDLGADGDDS